jgi:hypothetical protein
MTTVIRPDMCVRQVIERWPATREVFQSYGIPTETTAYPAWETIEGSAAAHGYWAAERLMDELIQAAGGRAEIRPETSLVELVRAYRPTAAVLERYGIRPPAESVAPWESIEQAAAVRGQWAVDGLVDDLNATIESFQGDDREGEPTPDTY